MSEMREQGHACLRKVMMMGAFGIGAWLLYDMMVMYEYARAWLFGEHDKHMQYDTEMIKTIRHVCT